MSGTGVASYEGFIERVRERAALDSDRAARAAIGATLATLGEGLSRDEAHAVADALPDPFEGMLRQAHFVAPLDAATFYERVRGHEHAPAGMAVEHAVVVCQVLGEALDVETRERLASALPAALAEQLVPRARPAPPDPRHPHPAPPGSGHTLADGRPGSHAPVSESSAEQTHRGSVASSAAGSPDARHAHTLSSGHPRTRERHSLADGKPGSDRPISEKD